jgi:hypothetical protein
MKLLSSKKTIFVLFSFAFFIYSCNSNSDNKSAINSYAYSVADTASRLWVGWNKYNIPENDSLAR